MTDRAPKFMPEPRGLKREYAARYVGVGPTKFDDMVKDGRMPAPKRVDGRTIWDRFGLDVAFDDLPTETTEPGDDDLNKRLEAMKHG